MLCIHYIAVGWPLAARPAEVREVVHDFLKTRFFGKTLDSGCPFPYTDSVVLVRQL